MIFDNFEAIDAAKTKWEAAKAAWAGIENWNNNNM